METTFIRAGFWAGTAAWIVMALLLRLAREEVTVSPDPDVVGDQVYQVLADARRILEEG